MDECQNMIDFEELEIMCNSDFEPQEDKDNNVILNDKGEYQSCNSKISDGSKNRETYIIHSVNNGVILIISDYLWPFVLHT